MTPRTRIAFRTHITQTHTTHRSQNPREEPGTNVTLQAHCNRQPANFAHTLADSLERSARGLIATHVLTHTHTLERETAATECHKNTIWVALFNMRARVHACAHKVNTCSRVCIGSARARTFVLRLHTRERACTMRRKILACTIERGITEQHIMPHIEHRLRLLASIMCLTEC